MEKPAESPTAPFLLGIDLGTNSLGWALIGIDDQGHPVGLIRCGVRVFEAGMDGDTESGQEESRNLKRRQMRCQRRQIWRRRQRQRKVFRLLQNYGLLPDDRGTAPEEIQDTLNKLDSSILASPWFEEKRQSGTLKRPDQVLPYVLRAGALDGELMPHYLGRALYHLAQRRGFESNRKAPPKKDEKPGEVKAGISELRETMAREGARTLGEHLSRLDPFERRIRQRWTARSMYEDEFSRIWDAQVPHHPQILTPERRSELRSAIFYQRRLWFPDDLVGRCELEPGEPRAAKYSFAAQRFRLLQSVNNLKLGSPDGSQRALTFDERAKLAEELESDGDRSFAQVRRLLGLRKDSRFSIENGGEKTLRGNRTTSAFCGVFGNERWLAMSAVEHEQALHDVLSIRKKDALVRRAVNHWKLDEEHAEQLAEISLEPDYFNLSRKAIEKLLPLLENGITYAEARRQLYPERFGVCRPFDSLPRLDSGDALRLVGEIRNPAVTRSLTELRKVVNAIVRQYGKPAEVRIELARDLKRSKKDRKNLTDRNRDNEAARRRMSDKIKEQTGLDNPSATDIRKALLHEECGGVCPYSGKPIAFKAVFGAESQFDIEHIIPYERCFDNSFANLTLCEAHENRHVKGGRTPWEAYHGDSERWEQILDRVKRFKSSSACAKLWRFQMTETEATEFINRFRERQLNDTRYASRLAAKYVAMLYGGLADEEHTRRVSVTSGEVTAQLRSAWKLNGILNDGPTSGGGELRKTRDDHRHHAVDAAAIALTNDSTIQQLSRASQYARERWQRRLASLDAPWGKDLAEFVNSVREQIKQVVVSHRVSRKVSGALHEETIYSRPFERKAASGETVEVVRVRKKLSAMTATEVKDIVDDAVKELVREKMEALGARDPKKAFGSDANLPCFTTADGRRIPVRSARVEKRVPAEPLGEGRPVRHVASESNHHVEIYAEVKPDGTEGRWKGEVVPMLEAYRRRRARKPVVERNHGPLARFEFSLARGEVVECDDSSGSRSFWIVRGMTAERGSPRVFLVRINDARQRKEMDSKAYWRPFLSPLLQLHARKVSVTPLGNIFGAHD